ncbi:hypothetical protein RRG08_057490 [Elysia crispata]|uniref:Uncharacterized protein n=1 Tax=Elysia crispata TaxID=231223 RepID=A0AAE1DLH2_9GAST|nr:hypothetical protein RRG08_057490 [Elysia crispata]
MSSAVQTIQSRDWLRDSVHYRYHVYFLHWRWIVRYEIPYRQTILFWMNFSLFPLAKGRLLGDAGSRDDAEPMGNLSGSKFFSKLDRTKGYWQVPVEEKKKPATLNS